MAVVKDLAGTRFGRLVAVRCVGRTKNGNAKWLCKCDCGGEKIVASWGLVSGRTNSCGCIKREQNKQMWTKHGESNNHKTRLYRIWAGMKTRCYNEHQEFSFKKYGARGVKMCEEWKNSYESFRDWAIKNGYQENLSIDRIDFYGDYSPENCRWATATEQARNTRSNRRIVFNGETKTMAEWAEISGFTYSTLEHRVNRGWSVADALQTPMRIPMNGKFVYIESKIGEVFNHQKFDSKLSARIL